MSRYDSKVSTTFIIFTVINVIIITIIIIAVTIRKLISIYTYQTRITCLFPLISPLDLNLVRVNF